MAPSTVIAPSGSAMPPPETPRIAEEVEERHLDEAAVVARAQRDPAAFAPLYQAYIGPIYRYCYRRLGSREGAEDATSLVFERALRSLASFRGGSFRAWLFAIAHNVVTDAYRRKGAHSLSDEALEVADPAPPPEQIALVADEQRLLMTALALLPADQRQVIELRLSGVSSVDVAAILNRSPQAVRALQLRATRRLQMLLAAPGAANEVRHA
jgi:RNA polymerase sigma-70 factor, ECF subfamily